MIEKLREYTAKGLISECKNKTYPELSLFCYTKDTEFDRLWDDVTSICRGLIWNTELDTQVSNPFPKFFNHNDPFCAQVDWSQKATITEKMDGSLFQVQRYKGDLIFSTKGSFYSEQAKKGKELFYSQISTESQKLITEDLTFLFEVIYPENRIVLNYGSDSYLTLLAIREVNTEKERNIFDSKYVEFNSVKAYSVNENFSVEKLKELAGLKDTSREGVVIRFESGLRVKVKLEYYLYMNRLVSKINKRQIWDSLRKNSGLSYGKDSEATSVDELLSQLKIEDDFYKIISDIRDEILQNKKDLEEKIISYANSIPKRLNPKEAYEWVAGMKRNFPEDSAEAYVAGILDYYRTGTLDKFQRKLWELIKPENNTLDG